LNLMGIESKKIRYTWITRKINLPSRFPSTNNILLPQNSFNQTLFLNFRT
jgi:hypothetical protein